MRHRGTAGNGLLVLGALLVTACSGRQAPHEEPLHAAPDTRDVHWGYGAHNGPGSWADLDARYSLCRDGREQSPVDLGDTMAADVPEVTLDYQPAAMRIIRQEHVVDVIDNGHTIQFNYDDGSVLRIGEQTYELAQFHFHAPSEHTIDGQHAPMEMHLVHQGSDGSLAVFGVLIEEGQHNPAFDPLWSELPDDIGEERHLEHIAVDVDDLLPESHRSFHYRGSLTTPPCTEGVEWLVTVDSIELSAKQISDFTSIIAANNRPVQVLGDRTIIIERVPEE